MSFRRSLLATAEEVVAEIKPGAVIGFGGILNHSHSMPVVRELIRRGVGDLHVVGTACGLEVDMLIAVASGMLLVLTSASVTRRIRAAAFSE